MTTGGTYTLLIELEVHVVLTFGAAGERELSPGWYAYTGSALGSGGFARVDRHYRLAAGKHDARHWHVDYLLGHVDVRLDSDVRSPGVDAECAVADGVARTIEPVDGVGATDCDCGSHLAFAAERATVVDAVRRAHEAAR